MIAAWGSSRMSSENCLLPAQSANGDSTSGAHPTPTSDSHKEKALAKKQEPLITDTFWLVHAGPRLQDILMICTGPFCPCKTDVLVVTLCSAA